MTIKLRRYPFARRLLAVVIVVLRSGRIIEVLQTVLIFTLIAAAVLLGIVK
jgi:hypothetical protein